MVMRMESKTRTPVRDLNARAAAQRYAALQFAHYMWFTTYTYLYLYNYHMYIYIYCTYMHAEIYNVHRTTLGRHKTNMLKLAARWPMSAWRFIGQAPECKLRSNGNSNRHTSGVEDLAVVQEVWRCCSPPQASTCVQWSHLWALYTTARKSTNIHIIIHTYICLMFLHA